MGITSTVWRRVWWTEIFARWIGISNQTRNVSKTQKFGIGIYFATSYVQPNSGSREPIRRASVGIATSSAEITLGVTMKRHEYDAGSSFAPGISRGKCCSHFLGINVGMLRIMSLVHRARVYRPHVSIYCAKKCMI